MRSRLTIVLATLASLAVLAAACGGGGDGDDAASRAEAADLPTCPVGAHEDADGPVEVVVWHFLQAQTRDALEQLAEQFNASQDRIVVRVENQGTNNEEVWSKYIAAAPSGELPGIAIFDETVTIQMVDSETVLPAASCIEADDYDMADFLPGAVAYYTIDGVLYPATLNLSAALLYYNRGHFARAGLDPDVGPATLAEVRTWAEQIKAAGVVDKPVVLQLSPAIVEMLLTGVGVPIVDNDNGRGPGRTLEAAFETPETLELFTWAREMIDDGLMDALPQTPGQIGQYLSMAAGQASMTIETSTAATSIEAFLAGDLDTSELEGSGAADDLDVDPDALDIGAAPVPGLREPGRLAMGGGAWYLTNTGPPEVQAAAWEFVKFVNELPQQATWNLVGGYLPYRISAVQDPTLQAAWTATTSGRWLAIAYDELLEGVDPDFPGPVIGPYDEFRRILRGQVEELIYRDASPEQVVSTAATETTDALVRYDEGGF